MNSFLAQLDLLLSRNGTPLTQGFRTALAARSNVPADPLDHILQPGASEAEINSKLWIVDRILEQQTVVHFLEFSWMGRLPSGKQTSLKLLAPEEVELLQQPTTAWAPSSFANKEELSTADKISMSIGSFEDESRLVAVSKELNAMKTRIWEGIMPLSDRRWKELQLDSPDNFHEACQHIAAVTSVFKYLNVPEIKVALRQTYNLIWGHLDIFDQALRAKKGEPSASTTALWHAFIKDKFTCVSNRSHAWVIDRVEHLRLPIIEQMYNEPAPTGFMGGYSPTMMNLADKIHDLAENASQADNTIFLPMDGYKGEDLPSQDHLEPDDSNPYREQPITFSANAMVRKADYFCRLKYLSRIEQWSDDKAINGEPHGLTDTVLSQVRAQARTRAELRGEETAPELEMWVQYAKMRKEVGEIPLPWGFVAYRSCYDHSDEEWKQFVAKFEADAANWGSELDGVDWIKDLSKIEWKDAKTTGTADENLDALKKNFIEWRGQDDESASTLQKGVFLVADKAAIDSYLNPKKDQRGHILAVDPDYDPNDPENRVDESPGYQGWTRVLGSLLWEDVAPMLLRQNQSLEELWPLSKPEEPKVYEGPLERFFS